MISGIINRVLSIGVISMAGSLFLLLVEKVAKIALSRMENFCVTKVEAFIKKKMEGISFSFPFFRSKPPTATPATTPFVNPFDNNEFPSDPFGGKSAKEQYDSMLKHFLAAQGNRA